MCNKTSTTTAAKLYADPRTPNSARDTRTPGAGQLYSPRPQSDIATRSRYPQTLGTRRDSLDNGFLGRRRSRGLEELNRRRSRGGGVGGGRK